MSVFSNPARQSLVDALHASSTAEEPGIIDYFVAEARRAGLQRMAMSDAATEYLAGKMVALDADKAEFCHLQCQALGARDVVEIGTSHGVSTLYLADAVERNGGGRVIATEHDTAKADIAARHLAQAGLAVQVDLRIGDLRTTLRALDRPVDFALIDIWTEMARPAIELIGPHLRPGAVVICDNTAEFAEEYADYFDYLADPANQFITRTLPFSGGLEFSVKCRS